ncbi:uncharacterized protein LOC119582204 [Penaeus monodon]|uniref:uncharacterized protein LOC119582204 n=1 Tax=Penaeus monodon TaxID=6687 RepID=UPI0018A7040E|nr:uncharacterized protein LOC119582204 [Penaeus monodon]
MGTSFWLESGLENIQQCNRKNCIAIADKILKKKQITKNEMDYKTVLDTPEYYLRKEVQYVRICNIFPLNTQSLFIRLCSRKLPKKVLVVCFMFLVCICYLWNEESLTKLKNDRSLLYKRGEPSEIAPPMWWAKFLCKKYSKETNNSIVLPVLMRDVTPSLDKNVFLIESACKAKPTYRAWCAVESFSRVNPEADVWFVITSPTVDNADGLPARLLERYSNLYVVTTDLETVFKNTSLEDFFMSGLWHKGTPWPIIQLSDILRVALVWRFGGFYNGHRHGLPQGHLSAAELCHRRPLPQEPNSQRSVSLPAPPSGHGGLNDEDDRGI